VQLIGQVSPGRVGIFRWAADVRIIVIPPTGIVT